jgi:hypothetical protein
MRLASLAAFVAAAGLFAGCAELLPTAKSEVSSPWHSFDDAKAAIERIVPNETSAADLRARGIDPYTSANVQLLSYSDILLRFPMNGTFEHDGLDRGLRTCLDAGKACSGYSINIREVKRDRTGGFFLDMLGFKRVTDTSGWSFNALILIVDDRAVYTLYGGQPMVREHEVSIQPLGPAQSFGESLPVDRLVP